MQSEPIGPTPPVRKARPPTESFGSVDLTEAAALDDALRRLPEVRPEAVARARELVGSTNYPPRDILQSVAQLLAKEFRNSATR